jgi:DNA polymerase-1
MAHTLDENQQKGLKPQAQARLGVPPWGIDTRDLLRTPLMQVLEYNAKDTFYTYLISRQMITELKARPRQRNIYKNLLMPASEVYVGAERRGVWTDRQKLASHLHQAKKNLELVETKLMEYVPEVGTNGWPCDSKGRPNPINWNTSNWARWFWFKHLDMPVLARGKEKDDGREGDPSMAEGVMLDLREITGHPAIDLHMERSKWFKYVSSFLGAYQDQLDSRDRIHTYYKLYGTVTGRTSSGKIDDEKITASRGRRAGLNMQQVPRDPFVRGVFGAEPGRAFVEADFSQVELRLAAHIAKERNMLHLYATGVDLHLATAARTTGKPLSEITKEERKKAKPTNFGFLYGMSWAKFIQTAWQNYGIRFDEDEAQATRVAFF